MAKPDPNNLPLPALELSQHSIAPPPRPKKGDPPALKLRLRLPDEGRPRVVVCPERREIEISFGLRRYRPGPALIRIKRAVDRDLGRLPRDNAARIAEVTKPHTEKLAWPITSCELARLRALGLITKRQFEAGVEYIKLLADYRSVIDAPASRRPPLVEREKLAWTRTDNPRTQRSGRTFGKETYGAATGAPAALSGTLTFLFRDQPPDADAVAPNPRRAKLNRLVREYALAGGVITKYPMSARALPVPRTWQPEYVPGKWRTGYVEFRWAGAQLLCPSPGVDPDTEGGEWVVRGEARILGYMQGARAALQRAQLRADKKRGCARIEHALRLVREDDVPITPDQLQDLKDGLTALSMYFTR